MLDEKNVNTSFVSFCSLHFTKTSHDIITYLFHTNTTKPWKPAQYQKLQ